MATHTTTSPPLRVLLADQSAFLREVLGQLIGTDPGLTLCAAVAHAHDLVPLAANLRPDVILAGPEMFPGGVRPVLDQLARKHPPAPRVILCIPPTSIASHDGLQALAEGATDLLSADRAALCERLSELRSDLLRVVYAAALRSPHPPGEALPTLPDEGAHDLIVMYLRPDGLGALERVLPELPPQFPTPIVIAHDLPRMCVSALTARLDMLGALSVHTGVQGIPLYPGAAYVLPAQCTARIRSLPGGPMRLELISGTGRDQETHHPVVLTPPRTLRVLVAGSALVLERSPETRGFGTPRATRRNPWRPTPGACLKYPR